MGRIDDEVSRSMIQIDWLKACKSQRIRCFAESLTPYMCNDPRERREGGGELDTVVQRGLLMISHFLQLLSLWGSKFILKIVCFQNEGLELNC